jgi:putative transposase
MDAVIEQLTLHDSFPLASLCETLKVSRAGYYAWRAEAQFTQLLKHKRRYGARRIAVELKAHGQPCGVDRVAKLLKFQGLRAIQPHPTSPKRPRAGTCSASVPTCS